MYIVCSIVRFIGPHCGFKSNEVQSGAEIQERGVRYEVSVQNKIVDYIIIL